MSFVLSSNADLVFTNGAEKILKRNKLTKLKQSGQKDNMKAKINITDSEADIRAQEQ